MCLRSRQRIDAMFLLFWWETRNSLHWRGPTFRPRCSHVVSVAQAFLTPSSFIRATRSLFWWLSRNWFGGLRRIYNTHHVHTSVFHFFVSDHDIPMPCGDQRKAWPFDETYPLRRQPPENSRSVPRATRLVLLHQPAGTHDTMRVYKHPTDLQ